VLALTPIDFSYAEATTRGCCKVALDHVASGAGAGERFRSVVLPAAGPGWKSEPYG